MTKVELFWICLGLAGQICFFLRFLFQWIVSEKKRESTIPVIFWFLSIFGGIILLIYSIYRKDPVFIIGQSMGILIYSRNIYFIYSKNK